MSGKKALSYSRKLVKGRWWTVLGYNIIFWAIGFITAIPMILLAITIETATPKTAFISAETINNTILAVAGSIISVMQVILYISCENSL